MYGNHIARNGDAKLILEADNDGNLLIAVTNGSAHYAGIRLYPNDVSALRTWLESEPGDIPSADRVLYGSRARRVQRLRDDMAQDMAELSTEPG